MPSSKRKEKIQTHYTTRLPLAHAYLLLILGLALIVCLAICVINSLNICTVKDIWLYQTGFTGSLAFVIGYLLGNNPKP